MTSSDRKILSDTEQSGARPLPAELFVNTEFYVAVRIGDQSEWDPYRKWDWTCISASCTTC